MPQPEQQGNAPQNNNENQVQQDGPVNAENQEQEDPAENIVVPEVDPANANLDGQEQEAGYVPPAPPEEDDGFENLNINAELGGQPVNGPAGNGNVQPQGVVRAEDDVLPEEEVPAGTYLQYVRDLKRGGFKKENVACMLAAAVLMQRDPRANVDMRGVADLAAKIQNQPAFDRLMEDPNTKKLKEAGNGLGLIELLAVKENERKAELNKYVRPAEFAYEDSLFLTAAKEQLKEAEGEGTPGAAPAANTKQGKLYREMMKQIEHAEALTVKGQQLSGPEIKRLITAVKKYNDGGTKVPGGTSRAPGSPEAMCILKRFMPADEYLSYCSSINVRRKRKLDPDAFTERRLYGQDLSVAELKKQCRMELQKNFTIENCAALVACATTAPKNGLIDAEEYERQKALLLEKGSAFSKAMQNGDVEKKIAETVKNGGKANKIIEEINDSAMEGLGRNAQWHFNRSRNTLLNTRVNTYFAEEHLANIMALHQFSLSAGMSDKVTNSSFAERAEEVRKDPVFRRMADRYAGDPEYRRHINNKLREDGTGATITEEYKRVQRSMRKKQPEAQEPQARPGA